MGVSPFYIEKLNSIEILVCTMEDALRPKEMHERAVAGYISLDEPRNLKYLENVAQSFSGIEMYIVSEDYKVVSIRKVINEVTISDILKGQLRRARGKINNKIS